MPLGGGKAELKGRAPWPARPLVYQPEHRSQPDAYPRHRFHGWVSKRAHASHRDHYERPRSNMPKRKGTQLQSARQDGNLHPENGVWRRCNRFASLLCSFARLGANVEADVSNLGAPSDSQSASDIVNQAMNAYENIRGKRQDINTHRRDPSKRASARPSSLSVSTSDL